MNETTIDSAADARSTVGEPTTNIWWSVARAIIHNVEADRDLAKGLSDRLRFRYLMTKLVLGFVLVLAISTMWILWGRLPR